MTTNNPPIAAWAPGTALAKLESRHNNAPCVLTDSPAEFNDVALIRLSDYEALQAENDRLREALSEKLIDSTMLKSIGIDNDALTLSAEGGICKIMADAFGQVLIDSKAENYVEAWFTSSEHPELGRIVVTVKKESGQTPHHLRIAAEQECENLRRLLLRCEPVLIAHAGASHMTDGFRPKRNSWDELVEQIDAALHGGLP